MDVQEYYDLLVRSAVDGTFPSHDGAVCVYRGDRTGGCPRRCAVGVLIPDARYTDIVEDSSCDEEWWEKFHDCVSLPAGLEREDLEKAQYAHDSSRSTDGWNKESFLQKINALDCFARVKQVERWPDEDGVGAGLAAVRARLPGGGEGAGVAAGQ